MVEYSSDEERFSAFVNFFKDNKNTLLISFFLLASVLVFSIGYKSYITSQNLKAAEVYDEWFVNLSAESKSALKDKENAPSIMDAVAEKSWSGKIVLGDKSINSTVLGITEGYYDVSNLDLGFGIFITETHQEDVRKVIVIGTRIVEKLFDNQNPIGQQVRVLNHRFTVVGVMEEQDNPGWGVNPNKTAYIPITTIYETL